MREIKFRAWIADEVYYLGDERAFMFWEDGKLKITYLAGLFEGTDEVMATVEDGFILEQFTGLKDRNGQEVFEGDVIKMIALHNDHNQKGAVDYASIYFSHGQFCIALDGYKIGTPLFNVKLSSSVEVIGNIHENGDLLK